MHFTIELKAVIAFVAIIALWYKFFRYVFPKVKVSSPEAIGRATGFLVITEIAFSSLIFMLIALIRKAVEIQSLIEVMYLLKLTGFLLFAAVGAFIALKTRENTHTMNVKIYTAVCFVPNLFISSLSYSSGTLSAASMVGVPLVSMISGYFLLRKYPQFFNN